jgi:hypothetical protein
MMKVSGRLVVSIEKMIACMAWGPHRSGAIPRHRRSLQKLSLPCCRHLI